MSRRLIGLAYIPHKEVFKGIDMFRSHLSNE
jgi:hypothetical protein